MPESRYYGVRVEGAKYGVGFGSALAIAISLGHHRRHFRLAFRDLFRIVSRPDLTERVRVTRS